MIQTGDVKRAVALSSARSGTVVLGKLDCDRHMRFKASLDCISTLPIS
jgi:hypothetical protein